MSFLRIVSGAAAAFILVNPFTQAAPPLVNSITPRGAERGKPVELTVAGANFTPATRLILPFPASATLLPDAKPNPAQVRFRLTVEPAVPLGIYPLRLLTEDGISAPLLFGVDALPNDVEVEDNSTFDKAQKVALPVVITGQCAGGDVDYFRFKARKGQRLVVETETARIGSAIVPQLRVTDDSRRFVGADDTQALQGDCRVAFVAPADGDYVVEMSDSRYRGGTPPHYRLRIAEYDWIDEVFPLGGRRGETVAFTLRGGSLKGETRLVQRLAGDLLAPGRMRLGCEKLLRPGMVPPFVAVGDLPERTWVKSAGQDPKALDVLPPVTIDSRLEHPGDSDRFQVAVLPGQRLRFAVEAAALGSRLDGVLTVRDQAGRQLALVDDVDLPPLAPGLGATKLVDPALDLTVPAGVSLVVLEVRDQRHRGGVNFGYRLTIEPAVADFVLETAASELNVPRGGSAELPVTLVRRGFTGPVQLMVPDLPPGWMQHGGHVPAGGATGVLTLTAPAGVAPVAEPPLVTVEGRGTSDGREVRRPAETQAVLSRDGAVALSVLPLARLALASTAVPPFTVQGPEKIEVVRGYPAALPVRIVRTKEQQALAVTVTGTAPAVPQPLLTFQSATAAAGAASASFTIAATASAPDDEAFDLVVQGQGKIGGAERVVTGPAATVTVRKPFTVAVPPVAVTLQPGRSVSVKGRLQRRPLFKEAVQLKLEGLPAGVVLSAPLQAVPAERGEFQFDLKADPKTAPAAATLTLTCSTTIAGVAYVYPPLRIPLQLAAAK